MGWPPPERPHPPSCREPRSQGALSRLRSHEAAYRCLQDRLEAEIQSGAGLILVLDFDGTLARIARRPADVRLDPEIRKTLRRLAANPLVGLAVLSGRSLTDIKRRVQLTGVVYGGCHGLEIEGPGLEFRHPLAPSVQRHLERAAATLEAAISRFPGADLERKGPALSLHYRRVVSSGLEALFKLTKEVAAQEGLTIRSGEKVWELVPPGHEGKSKALPLIRDHLTKRLNGRPPFAVYAGDDATDAETIRSLEDRGITIQVGGKRGTADYHLSGVSEFHAILRWIEGHRLLRPSHSTRSSGRGAKDSPSDGG